jgi:hypothetical protein
MSMDKLNDVVAEDGDGRDAVSRRTSLGGSPESCARSLSHVLVISNIRQHPASPWSWTVDKAGNSDTTALQLSAQPRLPITS